MSRIICTTTYRCTLIVGYSDLPTYRECKEMGIYRDMEDAKIAYQGACEQYKKDYRYQESLSKLTFRLDTKPMHTLYMRFDDGEYRYFDITNLEIKPNLPV